MADVLAGVDETGEAMAGFMRAFTDAVAGRAAAEREAAQLAEALRIRACDECGLRFGGGAGAFVQHRQGTRCLPPHVFESVLTEAGGIWYTRGTEPRS